MEGEGQNLFHYRIIPDSDQSPSDISGMCKFFNTQISNSNFIDLMGEPRTLD